MPVTRTQHPSSTVLFYAAWLSAATPVLAACPVPSLQPRVQFTIASSPIEGIMADVTGDGLPDLVYACSDPGGTSNRISILPRTGSAVTPALTFGNRIDIVMTGTPYAVAAADLDQDGKLDLVVTARNLSQVQVLRGLGGGAFATPVAFVTGASPYELVLSDFNSDGVTDIATANTAGSSISVLLGTSDGNGHWTNSFAPPVQYPTANQSLSIATGDVNNDGITDLFATEYIAGTFAVFLGQGSNGQGNGTFAAALHYPAGPEPYDLATGDLNADGRLDVVVASSGPGLVRVLLGSGTGFFPEQSDVITGVNVSGVGIGDLDGDGANDLVFGVSTTNTVHVARGLKTAGVANGSFAPPSSYANCCFPVHAFLGDINMDGKLDVMTCDYQSSSTSILLNGCIADPRVPLIAGIRDVPNDQGGKLYLTWLKSSLDIPGGVVTGYRVWRQVPPNGAATRALSTDPSQVRSTLVQTPNGTTETIFWEALATLPAQRLPGYGYTSSTPQDSMAGSNRRSVFFVSAVTASIDVYYDSDPDSGYSVDNLAPLPPSALTATATANSTQLQWLANVESDLAHYELHRGASADFTPSGATLIATPTSPNYLDPVPGGTAVYRLAAVDVHGNRGAFTTLLGSQVTDVGARPAGTLWLAAPSPNPSRGALALTFGLPKRSRVQLGVMDAQGRLVRRLATGERPAGEVHVRWDGRDDAGHALGAGLYWLRLQTDAGERTERIIRMK